MANGSKHINMTWEDFETYLPKYQFDEKQIDFFKDAFEILTHNKDTNKVTCFSSRCGIGKSTLIHTFMHCCIGNSYYEGRHEPQGLVVITDSIKRLEELSDSEKDRREAEDYWGEVFDDMGWSIHYKDFRKNVIVLKSDEPFKEQLVKQHYKPIVLLSTQRYFMLGKSTREQLFLFKFGEQTLPRNIIIFDECPQFSEIITIDSDNLTRIESALYKGLSNEVEDKKFVIDEYKIFKDRLLDQMDEKENLIQDSNVTVYWKDNHYTTITPNDKLFFDIIYKNIDSLSKQYPRFMKDILCLQKLAQNGAIFQCIKKKNGENYERAFLLLIDNREHFYLGQDKKFFVFDATADIDPRYDLDYVEMIDGKKYNKPLNMVMTNVKVSTSKNAICKSNKKAISIVNAIKNYLKTKQNIGIGRHKDILIIVYSNLIRKFQKDFKYIGYFGNLKGFNDYKELYRMAHIGMNRFPGLVYFLIYCGCHMEVYENLKKMSEEDSLKVFEALTKNKSNEYEKLIANVMTRCMLADFEQNIFRLAIRNYGNTEMVHVWTFFNIDDSVYKQLSQMIEDRYSPYGVVFEYEDTPAELKLEKIKNRKPPEGKKQTNAQKIIEWIEQLPSGTEYKTKILLQETGLTNTQFQKVKSKNTILNKILEEHRTDKKGYYKVP